MRIKIVAGVAVAAIVIGLVVWQRYEASKIWAQLDEAEAQLETPPGFEKLGSRREGTPYCVISCDEARILVALRSSQPLDTTCEAMLGSALTVSDDAAREPWDSPGQCFVAGTLNAAGDANITAIVMPVDDIARYADYDPAWVREYAEQSPKGSLLIEVRLNSGID